MRRALLCCALIALAAGACSSSSATPMPYNQAANAPAAPAASYAAAATAAPAWHGATPYPIATPYSWSTPGSDGVPFPSMNTNPYVDTTEDHLSTFGLDVDTASYTVARGAIAQGRRPETSTIRPEEWVNYFDQGYAAPETDTFAIHVDGAPTPFLTSGEVLLRVGVKGRAVSAGRRPSAALTFVVDCSGSMADQNKLEMVKGSLALLANEMRSDDRIAIVAFSTEARVVLGPTSGSDQWAIMNAISSLRPGDSTATSWGGSSSSRAGSTAWSLPPMGSRTWVTQTRPRSSNTPASTPHPVTFNLSPSVWAWATTTTRCSKTWPTRARVSTPT